MKRIFSFLLLALSLTNTHAQNPNLGTSGAKFLNIAVGARAAGMGGAVVGLNDDVNSVFWNPAGIAHLEKNAASFSYMRWFDMFDLNAAAASFNIEGWGTFAASVTVFSMDRMEITTEAKPNGTGRYYDAQDIAIGLTYARFLTDRFCVGVTAKLINQKIWNETASGVAFDVGTQYRLDFQNLTIAMKMSNFGADLQFDGEDLNVTYDKSSEFPLNRLTPARLVTEPYPLPLNFQVGIGFDIYTGEFMKAKGAIDAVHPNDNKERINTGLELSFFDRLFLRGGYRFKYDQESFSLGAGANVPIAGTFFNFDYAFAAYDVLPSVHRITVGVEF
jgi:hypothetical protein